MNRTARLVCLLLAAVVVLSLPLLVPSGALLDEERNRLLEEMPDESGWLTRLFPAAMAESPALAPLPMDFSPGRVADAQADTSGAAGHKCTFRHRSFFLCRCVGLLLNSAE